MKKQGRPRKDLTDRRFGCLVAKEFVGIGKNGLALWRCECDCGKEKTITSNSLLSGNTESCGDVVHYIKHGDSCNKRLYRIWRAMKQRCYTPNNDRYYLYGGRGITVCEEWLSDYRTFKEWALSHGYADSLTIDRINTNGNYEATNCRWATSKTQGNNRRSCHYITMNGENLSLKQWCENFNVSEDLVRSRLKRGWSIEDAFLVPKGGKRRK